MIDFQSKLDRFKLNWIDGSDVALAVCTSIASFRFFADDTPRFWVGDVAAYWPTVSFPDMQIDLPRFANVAGQDDGQRAA